AYVGHYGNEFASIDISNGEFGWVYRARPFPYFSSPAVNEAAVVFGGRDKLVHCLERKTGKARWTFRSGGRVDSSPVICNGSIVVGSDSGRLHILSLATGEERWGYDIGAAIQSSPAVIDGYIIVGADDGGVYAFRPKDQEK
ncbi:MAG: PQQ-binding-like beta-propeller repeat protein, partial [Lentisphaeria bacterium]